MVMGLDLRGVWVPLELEHFFHEFFRYFQPVLMRECHEMRVIIAHSPVEFPHGSVARQLPGLPLQSISKICKLLPKSGRSRRLAMRPSQHASCRVSLAFFSQQ